MSFSSQTNSSALRAAIQYAVSHNVICIASGGNEGQEEMVVYPAGNRNVIGVGSTSATDRRSSFSNYETRSIKLFAPGEALVTAYPGNNYALVWGTSFSTALTAGATALLADVVPDLDSTKAVNSLLHGHRVDDVGTRLDVLSMMMYLVMGAGSN
jgi:major intracellular serine protease